MGAGLSLQPPSRVTIRNVLCCHSASKLRLTLVTHGLGWQARLPTGFPRPEDWSGLPFPPPGALPAQGLSLRLLHWHQGSPSGTSSTSVSLPAPQFSPPRWVLVQPNKRSRPPIPQALQPPSGILLRPHSLAPSAHSRLDRPRGAELKLLRRFLFLLETRQSWICGSPAVGSGHRKSRRVRAGEAVLGCEGRGGKVEGTTGPTSQRELQNSARGSRQLSALRVLA